MNTTELAETAIIENDMARECILHSTRAVGRGRRPFARAELEGNGLDTDTSGSASFYYTPLGMLVCVAVKGLARERGVYTLAIASEEDGRELETRCAIPPLYARGGYAWCSALTGKITPSDITDKLVVIKELDRENTKVLAMGTVKSFVK